MFTLFKALLSLFLFTSTAHASSEEIMLGMIDYIEENSKYTYTGEKLPYIQIRTVEELCKAYYPPDVYEQTKEHCSVAGYYDHFQNVIYIADESGEFMVDEGFFETVLFHELVHFLQFANGENEKVQCINKLEADAYALQELYVEYMGYPEEQKPNKLLAILVSQCNMQYK